MHSRRMAPPTDVTDPGLMRLANYGGPTPTHQLETDSPVIDNGDPSGCDDTDGNPLATDQRGQDREAGGNCDTGAVAVTVALGISGNSLTNTASVQGTEIDPDPNNDSFTLDTPVAGGGGGCSLGFHPSSRSTIGLSGMFLLALGGYWMARRTLLLKR